MQKERFAFGKHRNRIDSNGEVLIPYMFRPESQFELIDFAQILYGKCYFFDDWFVFDLFVGRLEL